MLKLTTTTLQIINTPPPVRFPFRRRDGKIVYVIHQPPVAVRS